MRWVRTSGWVLARYNDYGAVRADNVNANVVLEETRWRLWGGGPAGVSYRHWEEP
ncbi:hypothetical protein ACFQU1_15780 [Chelatococcus sp. GCM10030263]|uniref:hypothetical protein n=1 Tax=Chelatococcus sp. GCM10030263 TaxID=3273387 RepID=UPI00361BBBAF